VCVCVCVYTHVYIYICECAWRGCMLDHFPSSFAILFAAILTLACKGINYVLYTFTDMWARSFSTT
jgi:hypothetical protein